MAKLGTNEFFDLNRLPKGWGTIIFPVSLNRMMDDQDAKNVFDHFNIFYPSKSNENKIGVNVLYTDGLYQWKPEKERLTRRRSLEFMSDHRNGYLKALEKNKFQFQIRDAYNVMPWDMVALSTVDFMDKYDKAFKLVKEDDQFVKYLREDCKKYGREYTSEQIGFFVEEIVVYYLLSKMKVRLDNMFTQNREEWVLLAYPGKPLKSQVYFHQKNIFDIKETGNAYENSFYDLESKKLYDFDRLDLETWNYE